MKTIRYSVVCTAVAVAADRPGRPGPGRQETLRAGGQLIAVLQGSSSPADKAMACKKLAVFGSQTAAPALPPLLADEHLASWARIALEAIPGPACDQDAPRGARTTAGQARRRGHQLLARRKDKEPSTC